MNSMADNKLSVQKEKHLDSKTKSHQPRTNTEVERTFQESA